jgi:hypothetical protein
MGSGSASSPCAVLRTSIPPYSVWKVKKPCWYENADVISLSSIYRVQDVGDRPASGQACRSAAMVSLRSLAASRMFQRHPLILSDRSPLPPFPSAEAGRMQTLSSLHELWKWSSPHHEDRVVSSIRSQVTPSRSCKMSRDEPRMPGWVRRTQLMTQ